MNNENNQGENKSSDGAMMNKSGSGKNVCMGKDCGCGHPCNHGHLYVLRWILKIVILIIIFCFAFKMGELKGMLESRDGGYNMMYRGSMMHTGYGGGYGGTMPMSGTGAVGTAVPPSTTTAPVTPAQ